jgi:putative protein-disulfide isomerase
MEPTVLHYIYDPLCGWCYGAAPLLKAAAEIEGVQVHLHAGGMMMGPRRQPAAALRDFVMQHDRRIAELTGQPFGEAYREGLLRDATAVFDSEPPITAILQAGEQGRAMLDRIQRGHFVEGRKIADRAVLDELAGEIGITLARNSPVDTAHHVQESRQLLQEAGGSGFPTFAYRQGSRLRMLDSSRYLGHPREWQASLQAVLQTVS